MIELTTEELAELTTELHSRYGAALATFEDVAKQMEALQRVADFCNELKVGPAPGLPERTSALVSTFHAIHKDVQAAGFADGARWAFEELQRRGLLTVQQPAPVP